jgi:hypothetical protein
MQLTFRNGSINSVPQQVIIGSSPQGIVENRDVSSLESFKRGDYIEYNGHMYIVYEEVKTPRHNKDRATMTSCNYSFSVRDFLGKEIVGFNEFGMPIYKENYSELYQIYGAMKQWDRSLEQSFAINMMQITFFIDVQDNANTREQFKLNNIYDIKGKNMTVAMHDLSQEGLIGVLFLTTGKSAPY